MPYTVILKNDDMADVQKPVLTPSIRRVTHKR